MDRDKGIIGVISDTHGLLRPEALAALDGSDLILHSGDVGRTDILDKLREIAPVYAVRGNVDYAPGCRELPLSEGITFAGCSFYILHILEELDIQQQAAGFDAIIYGHTHQPRIHYEKGVLYLNPGSAGPRRFSLPVSVAKINIKNGTMDVKIVEFDC